MKRNTWPWSQDWHINGALEFSRTCQTTLAQMLLDWISKPFQGHEKIYEQNISDPEIDSCQTVPNRYFCVANQYQLQWFNSSSWSVHCARGTLCGLQSEAFCPLFYQDYQGLCWNWGSDLIAIKPELWLEWTPMSQVCLEAWEAAVQFFTSKDPGWCCRKSRKKSSAFSHPCELWP